MGHPPSCIVLDGNFAQQVSNMTALYFLAGMVVFWSVLLTVIFRFEKGMVWPYSEPEAASQQAGPQFGDPSGYATKWTADAVAAGFRLLGWSRDLKGPIYRISYAMLVSPEQDIFAIIGAGTVMSMQVAGTWLYSPTGDGRAFYSTDKQAGVKIDLSRNWTNQLVPATSFQQLLQSHREWIRSNGVFPRLFTAGREFAEFRAIREEHYRAMQRAGLIRFTDGAATHFYFTLSGAARTATWGYFLGMARQLSGGRFPRNA